MKKIVVFLFMLQCCLSSIAQVTYRFDSKWLLGLPSPAPCSSYVEIDFSGDTVTQHILTTTLAQANAMMQIGFENAGIVDSMGNWILYTNGLQVRNRYHQLIQGGETLGLGSIMANAAENNSILTHIQGALILPDPKDAHDFYLFYVNFDIFPFPAVGGGVLQLLWAKDKGWIPVGYVLEKNQIAIDDTLAEGYITACKHGNGKDWWVLMPDAFRGYYRVLVDETGVHPAEFQETQHFNYAGLGNAMFSPDGTKYVRYNVGGQFDSTYYVYIFDFDRCTGLLSNERRIEIPSNQEYGGGAAISPNSRFLYVATAVRVFQFDLWASDIEGSKQLVGIRDNVLSCTGNRYNIFTAQLAPNGKIYFTCPYQSCDALHVIEYPDSQGVACQFRPHGLNFPGRSIFVPNHPNYYLGALPNPCPTVSITAPFGSAQGAVKVYPNPAGLVVNVETSARGVFMIKDLQGREVLRQMLTEGKTAISVGNLAKGVYIWEIFIDNRKEYGKLVIQR